MSLPASPMPVRDLDILSGEDFLSMFMQSATSTNSPPGIAEDAFTTLEPVGHTEIDEDSFTSKPKEGSHNNEKIPSPYTEQDIVSYTTDLPESSHSLDRTTSKDTDLQDLSISSHYRESPQSDIKESTYDSKRTEHSQHHLLRGNSSYDKGRATLIQNPISNMQTRNEFSVDESAPIVRQPEKVKRKSEDLLAIGANPDYIAQQQSRLNRDNIQYQHPYNRQLSRSRSVSYSAVVQTPWKQNITESTAESKDYYVTHKYNQNEDEFNDSLDKKDKKSYEQTERNWGLPEKPYGVPTVYGKPEQNYEIDEAVSVITNGRIHGVQPTEKPVIKPGDEKDDNQKVGYVVEGRNFRKYRVEERTSDGFIVGEYGVVSNNDGSLRGVRYTADGTINPRVIYDALMKFLSL